MTQGRGMPVTPGMGRRAALTALVAAVAAAHLLLLSAPQTGSGARLASGPPDPRLRAPPPLTLRTVIPPATHGSGQAPAAALPPPARLPKRGAGLEPAAASMIAPSARNSTLAPAPALPSQAPSHAPMAAVTPASAIQRELLPDPPAAAAVPGPLTLHYQLSGRSRGREVQGRAQLSFQHDGHRYEIRHEILMDPPGVRLQTSTGLLGPQGLAPRRFGEHRRSEEAVHFDPVDARITFSAAVLPGALMPGAQDRLSILLQLGAVIAAQPSAFGPGRSIAVQVASAREAAVWRFTVVGEEDLVLPLGPLRALHLARPPQHEFEPLLDLWLAPGRAYAPVRLRLTAPNGDWLEHMGAVTDKP